MADESKRGQLHQLLPAESDLQKRAMAVLTEAQGMFKKRERFTSFTRRLEMFDEGRKDEQTVERQDMTTTVHDKLEYIAHNMGAWLDAFAQKERSNQEARADLVVDDKTIVANVPATTLLGLETKLSGLRRVLEQIPTTPPGFELVKREGLWHHVHPEERMKTEKDTQFKILYQHTDKHPAQIKEWTFDKPVGKYVKSEEYGMYSPKELHDLLSRLDKLIISCKQARHRANCVEITHTSIGDALFDYILNE